MEYPEAFNAALKILLKLEGGEVNNPADPGGATNLGISLRAVKLRDFDRDHKLDFDLDKDGDVDEKDIHLVTGAWDAVQQFYYTDYWLPAGCDTIYDYQEATIQFDCAVNQGVRVAVEIAKEAETSGLDVFFYLYRRLSLYSTYKNAPAFIKGWGNRLERLRKELFI